MEKFRSICYLQDGDNDYEVTYLKEFFKWIGFSYLELSENSQIIRDNIEDCSFDIFVHLKRESVSVRERFPGCYQNRLIELEMAGHNENVLLDMMVEQIKKLPYLDFSEEEKEAYDFIILELKKIYQKYFLVNVLFEYTSIVIEYMKGNALLDSIRACGNRMERVLEEIELLIDKRKNTMSSNSKFMEYLLYAKYSTQIYINRMLVKQKTVLRYRPDDFVKNVNEIYKYDQKMFKVEVLKARICEQDESYNGRARISYEVALDVCPIRVCKSFHYYNFGKWEALNNAPFDAYESYRNAYFCYNENIKAIFKIATHKMAIRENETAKYFLTQGVDLLKDPDQTMKMSPKDVEYAYKFRMLFTEIVSKPVAIGIEEEAKAYLDSIDDLRLTKRENMTDEQKNSFLARLYPDNEPNSAFKLEDMCFAILRRIECKRELKDVGEDSTNS